MASKGVTIRVNSDSRRARQDLQQLNRSVGNIEKTTQNVKRAFVGLGATIGVAFAASRIKNTISKASDSLTLMGNSIAQVTGRGEELVKVQNRLFDISRRTATNIQTNTKVFKSFGLALKDAGRNSQEVLTAVESLALAGALGGESQESLNAALIQLGQGISAGALRGEELNSVLEQAPRIAKAISDELGVTRGALRGLGKEGAITAEVVVGALLNQNKALQEEFKQMEFTSVEAFSVVKDQATRVIGEIDRELNLTQAQTTKLLAFANQIEANRSKIVSGVVSRVRNSATAFKDLTTTVKLLGSTVSATFSRMLDAIPAVRVAAKTLDDVLVVAATSALASIRQLNRSFALDVRATIRSVLGVGFEGAITNLFRSKSIKEFNTNLDALNSAISTYGRRWFNITNLIERDLRSINFFLLDQFQFLGIIEQKLIQFRFTSFERFSKLIPIISDSFKNLVKVFKASNLFAFLTVALKSIELTFKRVAFAVDDLSGGRVSKGLKFLARAFKEIANLANSTLNPTLSLVDKFVNRVERGFFFIYDEVIGNSWWTDTMEQTAFLADKWLGVAGRTVSRFTSFVTEKFSETFSSVRPILNRLGESVSDAFSNVDLSLSADTFTNGFSNAIREISSKVGQIAEALIKGIKATSPEIKAVIGAAALAGLLLAFKKTAIVGSLKLLFAAGASLGVANALGGNIISTGVIGDIGAAIGGGIGAAIKQAISLIPEAIGAALQAIKGLGKGLREEVGGILGIALDFVSLITGGLSDNLTGLLLGGGLLALFSKGFRSAVQTVFGAFQNRRLRDLKELEEAELNSIRKLNNQRIRANNRKGRANRKATLSDTQIQELAKRRAERKRPNRISILQERLLGKDPGITLARYGSALAGAQLLSSGLVSFSATDTIFGGGLIASAIFGDRGVAGGIADIKKYSKSFSDFVKKKDLLTKGSSALSKVFNIFQGFGPIVTGSSKQASGSINRVNANFSRFGASAIRSTSLAGKAFNGFANIVASRTTRIIALLGLMTGILGVGIANASEEGAKGVESNFGTILTAVSAATLFLPSLVDKAFQVIGKKAGKLGKSIFGFIGRGLLAGIAKLSATVAAFFLGLPALAIGGIAAAVVAGIGLVIDQLFNDGRLLKSITKAAIKLGKKFIEFFGIGISAGGLLNKIDREIPNIQKRLRKIKIGIDVGVDFRTDDIIPGLTGKQRIKEEKRLIQLGELTLEAEREFARTGKVSNELLEKIEANTNKTAIVSSGAGAVRAAEGPLGESVIEILERSQESLAKVLGSNFSAFLKGGRSEDEEKLLNSTLPFLRAVQTEIEDALSNPNQEDLNFQAILRKLSAGFDELPKDISEQSNEARGILDKLNPFDSPIAQRQIDKDKLFLDTLKRVSKFEDPFSGDAVKLLEIAIQGLASENVAGLIDELATPIEKLNEAFKSNRLAASIEDRLGKAGIQVGKDFRNVVSGKTVKLFDADITRLEEIRNTLEAADRVDSGIITEEQRRLIDEFDRNTKEGQKRRLEFLREQTEITARAARQAAEIARTFLNINSLVSSQEDLSSIIDVDAFNRAFKDLNIGDSLLASGDNSLLSNISNIRDIQEEISDLRKNESTLDGVRLNELIKEEAIQKKILADRITLSNEFTDIDIRRQTDVIGSAIKSFSEFSNISADPNKVMALDSATLKSISDGQLKIEQLSLELLALASTPGASESVKAAVAQRLEEAQEAQRAILESFKNRVKAFSFGGSGPTPLERLLNNLSSSGFSTNLKELGRLSKSVFVDLNKELLGYEKVQKRINKTAISEVSKRRELFQELDRIEKKTRAILAASGGEFAATVRSEISSTLSGLGITLPRELQSLTSGIARGFGANFNDQAILYAELQKRLNELPIELSNAKLSDEAVKAAQEEFRTITEQLANIEADSKFNFINSLLGLDTASSIEEAFSAIGVGNASDYFKLDPGLQSKYKDLLEQIVGIDEALVNTTGTQRDELFKQRNIVVKNIDLIVKQANAGSEAAKTAINNISGAFRSNFKEVIKGAKSLKEGILGVLDAISNSIIDTIVDSFVTGFTQAALGGESGNLFKGFFEGLFGTGEGAGKSLGESVSEIEFGSLTDGLNDTLKDGGKSITGFFGGIFDTIGSLFQGGAGGGGFLGGLFSIGSSILGAFGGGIGGTTGSFGLPISFSQGGTVPNTRYSQAGVDSVPALLTPGEMVVKRSAVNNMRQQGGNNSQQVVNLNITGDISTATKKEVMKMIPQIAGGVNYTNRQNNYKG